MATINNQAIQELYIKDQTLYIVTTKRQTFKFSGGGGGAVSSVNTQIGDVVLETDDITEAGNKLYISATELAKLAGIEPGATADQNSAEVPYDNAISGLTATDVKAALDELNVNIVAKQEGHVIEEKGTPLTQRVNMNYAGEGSIARDNNPDTDVLIIQLLEGAVNKDLATNYVFKGQGKVEISSTQTNAFKYYANGTNGISAVTFSVRTEANTVWETITFANLVNFLNGTFTTAGETYSVGTTTNWQVRFEAAFGGSAPSIDFGILMNLVRIRNI